MFPKPNIKKNLNLIKKSKKDSSVCDVKLESSTQEGLEDISELDINEQLVSDGVGIDPSAVDNLIGTLKNTIVDTQYDPIGPSEEENNEISRESDSVSTCSSDSTPTAIRFESRWNRKKYDVNLAKLLKGSEMEDFIKGHPDFIITNSIDTFEHIEIHEYGLHMPDYNFEHIFKEESKIETGVDLEVIPKGTCGSEILKSITEFVASDNNELFEVHRFKLARIIGKKITNFEFLTKIYRVKKVNKTICLFGGDQLITFDLKKFQKWKISATDATENNLGEFIVLESDKIINVYKGTKLVNRLELNTIVDNIASYYDRKIVVSTIYKIIFILDLDTKHIEIICGPPDEVCRSLEVYKNILILQTRFRLNFIDLANKTRHFTRFDREFKTTRDTELVRAYNFRDNFRYFRLDNPLETLSVTYNERIKGFESHQNRVYLAIKDSILIFNNGKLIEEIDARIQGEEYDFKNTIFTEKGFDRWKATYDKIKEEQVEFIPNEINERLKSDLDNILGRGKVKAKFAESQTSVSSQKKKKGGF